MSPHLTLCFLFSCLCTRKTHKTLRIVGERENPYIQICIYASHIQGERDVVLPSQCMAQILPFALVLFTNPHQNRALVRTSTNSGVNGIREQTNIASNAPAVTAAVLCVLQRRSRASRERAPVVGGAAVPRGTCHWHPPPHPLCRQSPTPPPRLLTPDGPARRTSHPSACALQMGQCRPSALGRPPPPLFSWAKQWIVVCGTWQATWRWGGAIKAERVCRGIDPAPRGGGGGMKAGGRMPLGTPGLVPPAPGR